MTDTQKIVLEIERFGKNHRVNISALDAEGFGHGYRIAGPKYSEAEGDCHERIILDRRDVEEIRDYLKIFDAMEEE